MEFYQLVLIVILYSSIQSIIGIGLLLFGTPTLLLAGYSYPETLWILLPASCSLSLMQIFEGRALIESKRDVFIFTLPALFFSLILVIQLDYIFDIKKIVGIFLLAIVLIRSLKFSTNWIRTILKSYKKLSFIFIGLIHGFSNLGGGPLSVVMSSIFQDKKKINANIAFTYFLLALSQLTILSIYQANIFSLVYLFFVPIALFMNIVFNKMSRFNISNDVFKGFLNVIILLFGFFCLIG